MTQPLFSKHKQSTLALNQVSFHVKEGETLGIVGESGCGKSTLGKSLMRLTEPTSGSIQLKGQEITLLKERDMRSLRKDIQMIFQDPYASLNPRMKIKDILEEPLIVHQHGTKAERRKRVKEMRTLLDLILPTENVMRINSAAGKGAVSVLLEHLLRTQVLSLPMNQFRLWMYPFKRKF